MAPAAEQPATTVETPSNALPDAPGSPLPYPAAVVVPQPDDRTTVEIESTNPQVKVGSHYTLDKDVVIHYGDRVIHADHIEYDSDTGDVTATGHLLIEGGPNHEHITASHGTLNVQTQTGRFYDAVGSVGLVRQPGISGREVYATSNPFLFSGKVVVKRGPQEYDVYDGTVTSCQLPKPDWLLSSGKFSIDGEKAHGSNSIFHVFNLPLLYLPYVTQPTGEGTRQSGILIPEFGNSSTKGFVIGDSYYLVLNRSMDLTLGLIYYSLRGWSELGTIRYRGVGQDFLTAHFSALQDRGYTPEGGVYTNQGGADTTLKARHDLSDETRVAIDAEYLTSYIYREAFSNNFNQAVTTDILSDVYGVHNQNGTSTSLLIDRYEGEKPLVQTPAEIAVAAPVVDSQITIFHIPTLNLTTTEHPLGAGRLLWSFDGSAAGLKRTQPGFTTGGVGRLDLHPELAYPFALGNWHIRPSVGARETFYNDSRLTQLSPAGLPVESTAAINRSDLEAAIEIRPPAVERTFDSPFLNKIFHGEVKHTIEPDITYRYVAGINNFQNILRFDPVDVASDTDELEYGVTQRLFLKPGRFHPCRPAELGKPAETPDATEDDTQPDDTPNGKPAPTTPRCGTREFFSWRLAQKAFFNENFGGAIVDGQRNIFETTLNYTGIAFLTEPRSIAPLLSRLRIRPSDDVDVEWDFDYDTGASKFTTNNIFVDVHKGDMFGGFSIARLDAPGRFYTDGLPSYESNFNQMRILLGEGKPTKVGLSVAGSGGFDLRDGSLQYATVQASYNWNCCGVNVEYRKFELGAVTNESVVTYGFTLANLGSAGTLRRAASLF